MSYKRDVSLQSSESLFLFGPRGAGKTYWLEKKFSSAHWFNLLKNDLYLELLSNPSRFREEVSALPKNKLIIVDEIQKIPALLDEIHYLIEKERRKFILTGSSARKLKRGHANLLAGRAIIKKMFPLTWKETEFKLSLDDILRWGLLPKIHQIDEKQEFLDAYILTYLKEEVLAEGILRKAAPFNRFLQIAALSHGEILNISNVSRECQVPRKTVEEYFSILEDLLIGYRLPAFSGKAKRRLTGHPKFYYFDSGIVNNLVKHLNRELDHWYWGHIFEGYLLHEIYAWNHYSKLNQMVSFWRTKHGLEVDFIVPLGEGHYLAVEVKNKVKFEASDLTGLKAFRDDHKKTKAFLVYRGEKQYLKDGIEILPVKDFCKKLYQIKN